MKEEKKEKTDEDFVNKDIICRHSIIHYTQGKIVCIVYYSVLCLITVIYKLCLQVGTDCMLLLLKCCFTSTETVSLLGTGAQDGHIDFHTAPEL